jgi:multidrug efflux pump subunit AcrB
MIYMNSQSTGDGKLTLTMTFNIGTDLNVAQMLTQNRVQDCAAFVPSAFLSGITGQFFRQFAITIAASTVRSW